MILKVDAVTFDDFNTLRYGVGKGEDIIYPILRSLKKSRLEINEEDFLKEYFRADKLYREMLRETLRESLLDDILADVLVSLGQGSQCVNRAIRKAVDVGLATRKTKWYSGATHVLLTLKEKGYKLGLISNTHWRFLENSRRKFRTYFDVITLSYEHGYAKPHPSIFLTTLERLKVRADRCLHVGDDPVADIEGAKGCGMKTAFIKRADGEANADIQIRKLSELLRLLKI